MYLGRQLSRRFLLCGEKCLKLNIKTFKMSDKMAISL